MVIPPPNVTGSLHLGHALTSSIQDAIMRWNRMHNRRVLWIPGTDHAGIATQAVVEKKIWQTEQKRKSDFTREEFVKRVWEWKEQYGHTITTQIRRMGSSTDWSREFFTMTPQLSESVVEAFIQLYEKGKIYRKERLVNWSCQLQTAISDIEVDYLEVPTPKAVKIPGYNKPIEFGYLWEFAYKVDGSDEEIVVATTRPETMLGDTAVAVHPEDPRYKHLHGKSLVHPFVDRKIPIVTDATLVDMNFGTGAVKITPAHDPNDYECGLRHNLPFINILNGDGTINENGGHFAGLKRLIAREKVIEELDTLKLFKGTKPNAMNISICSRSGDVIEPLLLPQWYIKCDEMAKKALDAEKSGDLKICPNGFTKTWYQWLENIRDWCISRQLWWGHRIPAYLVSLKGKTTDSLDMNNWVIANSEEKAREMAKERFQTEDFTLTQDPDVLDTWFSSGLLPFTSLGWPKQTEDFKTFYPNTILETGHDILFFWVARMVMLGIELTGQTPFNTVFLHAMVRDAHGRKMSKSLGNVIDPIDVIDGISQEGLIEKLKSGNLEKSEITKASSGIKKDFPKGIEECGTDALRFALCSYTSQERDINLDILRIFGYRKFCNKMWNATKLVFMVLGDYKPKDSFTLSGCEHDIDLWILSRLNETIVDANSGFETYNFSKTTSAIYSFWLYDLCDYYLESVKLIEKERDEDGRNAAKEVLYTCIEEGLRLIHPFMPFISEDLWQRLPKRSTESAPSICVTRYPVEDASRFFDAQERDFENVKNLISNSRSLMVDLKLLKKDKPKLFIIPAGEKNKAIYTSYQAIIQKLTYVVEVEILPEGTTVAEDIKTVKTDNFEVSFNKIQ